MSQNRPKLGHCGDTGNPFGLQSLRETWNAHLLLKGLGPLVFGTWDPRHYNQALWATADPEVP